MELHDEVHSSPLRKQKRNTRPADEKYYIHNTNQAEVKENYAGISRQSTAMEFIPVTASQPLGKQKGAADKQDKKDVNLESEEEHIAEHRQATPVYDAAYVNMLESYAVQLKLITTILQNGIDL